MISVDRVTIAIFRIRYSLPHLLSVIVLVFLLLYFCLFAFLLLFLSHHPLAVIQIVLSKIVVWYQCLLNVKVITGRDFTKKKFRIPCHVVKRYFFIIVFIVAFRTVWTKRPTPFTKTVVNS